MDASGSVIQKHYSKFRQINRYLEIVDDVFPCLPEGRVKIIDFGCGKAYLTFALYHYLRRVKGLQADIIGLDLKEDVIEFCSQVADDLGYEGLRFSVGDIAEYEDTSADMVVTLHACDTATDYALINAVSWNTRVILSVPCCQHELFSQIDNPVLDPMLRHGIIRDRFTEILTDGVRGLKLESKGYDVSMIEFTSLEHTARNIMIKAIKTRDPEDARSQKAAAQYAAICREYKIHPTIGEMK
ncbi:MAG: class I SAM-dependent methyltransferase [Anaerovoracaceae bacterium]|jgi:SAM-dependent methyltransferase